MTDMTRVVIVQLLSHVWFLATPWTAVCQASLPFTISWICSNSSPLSPWCHPIVSSSAAAAAAAKSLQSCPTLCDPTDGSPTGSPVPGILQARILEWVAISFSNAWKWKVKVKSLSHVWLLVTPWTAAHQAPPSMGFSRQEFWSGVPLPSSSIAPLFSCPQSFPASGSFPKSGLFASGEQECPLKITLSSNTYFKVKPEPTIAVLDVDISPSVVEWGTQKRKLPSPSRDYSGNTKSLLDNIKREKGKKASRKTSFSKRFCLGEKKQGWGRWYEDWLHCGGVSQAPGPNHLPLSLLSIRGNNYKPWFLGS